MKIERIILGAYETNCYVCRSTDDALDCLIIDTGLEAAGLIDFLAENKLNPLAVILTHGHVDHIYGLTALRESFPDVKVYIHKIDADMLSAPSHNLSLFAGTPFKTDSADELLEDGRILELAGLKLQVLHTPGHTPGGICLYAEAEGVVFVGDTLFADSVGRTDFPKGSMIDLINSIKQKLCVLPDETIVHPGHGPSTTIAREKAHNQYLQYYNILCLFLQAHLVCLTHVVQIFLAFLKLLHLKVLLKNDLPPLFELNDLDHLIVFAEFYQIY